MNYFAAQAQAIRLIIPPLPENRKNTAVLSRIAPPGQSSLIERRNQHNAHTYQYQPPMTQTTTTRDANADPSDSEGSSSFSTPNPRICNGGCDMPISPMRLAASPNARVCVKCLEAAGDVPKTLRLDECGRDGTRIETYFSASDDYQTKQIERHMEHMNHVVPAPLFYSIAVGDDSDFVREGNSVIDVARPLADEFENDPIEEQVCSLAMAA